VTKWQSNFAPEHIEALGEVVKRLNKKQKKKNYKKTKKQKEKIYQEISTIDVEDFLKRVKTEFLQSLEETNAQSLKDFEDIKTFSSLKSSTIAVSSKIPQIEPKIEETKPEQVTVLKESPLEPHDDKKDLTPDIREIEEKQNDLEDIEKELNKDSKPPIDMAK